jgi:hypothetical protein
MNQFAGVPSRKQHDHGNDAGPEEDQHKGSEKLGQ